MRAIDLSLAHKCYRVDVDSIKEAEIDSLIMYKNEDKIRVVFYDDRKLYFPKKNAINVDNLYYFSLDEAKDAQKKMRTDALIKVNQQLQKFRNKCKALEEKYGKEEQA